MNKPNRLSGADDGFCAKPKGDYIILHNIIILYNIIYIYIDESFLSYRHSFCELYKTMINCDHRVGMIICMSFSKYKYICGSS